MELPKKRTLSLKQKRIFTGILLVIVLLFCGAICYFIGKPLIKFVSAPEKFRAWVNASGILGRIAFIGMVIFQTVIALVPGEPFEIGAGYAFGMVEGTILCIIGITLGSIIIFALVRTLGIKVVEVFFSVEKIRSLKFLSNTKRLNTIAFIVFLIPGTPKDLLSYFVGLTNMKLTTWLIIASIARIPSVITSTAGGDALGDKNYKLAIIFFVVAAVVSTIGLIIYNKISKKKEEKSL